MIGSELFGTSCMSTNDIAIFIKANQQEFTTAQEISEDIKLIDDLLILIKSQSLLRKKRNLKSQIDRRLDIEIGVLKAPSQE